MTIPNLITGGIGPASAIKYLVTGGMDIGEEADVWAPVSAAAGTWSAQPTASGTWSATTPASGTWTPVS